MQRDELSYHPTGTLNLKCPPIIGIITANTASQLQDQNNVGVIQGYKFNEHLQRQLFL